jgi:hypothetical protein
LKFLIKGFHITQIIFVKGLIMKTLSELWKEFDEKGLTLTPEGLLELKWHVEHDDNLLDALRAARDMIGETTETEKFKYELVPLMAKHLNHKDPMVRDSAVGAVITTCESAEYGKKALVMARFDPEGYVRTTALGGIGWIMNNVESKLARKIAMHLYSVLTSPDEKEFDYVYRGAAEASVMISMGIHYPEWGTVSFRDVWKRFLKKYNLKEKELLKVTRMLD